MIYTKVTMLTGIRVLRVVMWLVLVECIRNLVCLVNTYMQTKLWSAKMARSRQLPLNHVYAIWK